MSNGKSIIKLSCDNKEFMQKVKEAEKEADNLKKSFGETDNYAKLNGRSIKKMGVQIASATATIANMGNTLKRGDFVSFANGIASLSINVKTFSSAMGKASPEVAKFASSVGGILGKVGVYGTILASVGAGIKSLFDKLSEYKQEQFEKMWDAQNVSLSKYGDKIGEHMLKMEELRAKVHNANLPLQDRLDAIESLKKIVPNYTAQISKEGKVYNENASALANYVNKLTIYYEMLALKDKYIEKIKKGLDLEEQLRKKMKQLAQTKANYAGASGWNMDVYGDHDFGGGAVGYGIIKSDENAVEDLKRQVNENKRDINDYKNRYINKSNENGSFDPNFKEKKVGSSKGGSSKIETGKGGSKNTTKGGSNSTTTTTREAKTKNYDKLGERTNIASTFQNPWKDYTRTEYARNELGKIQPTITPLIFTPNNGEGGYKDKLQQQRDLFHQFYMAKDLESPTYEEMLANQNRSNGSKSAEKVNNVLGDISEKMQPFESLANGVTGLMDGLGMNTDALKGMTKMLGIVSSVIQIATSVMQVGQVLGLIPLAKGGIVGGHSFTQDSIGVNLSSGEMVLPRQHQKKLYDMIENSAIGTSQNVVVEGQISGETIYLSNRNYQRRTGR